MNTSKVVITGTLFLFGLIAFVGIVKKAVHRGSPRKEAKILESYKANIDSFAKDRKLYAPVAVDGEFPRIDRVNQLFTLGEDKLPIVQTVTYRSLVPWLKGRPAWISDYAGHFGTSRHFIARCLNGKAAYEAPMVHEGNRFNVYEGQLEFFLVIDLSRCQMGVYYLDVERGERIFLKAYPVGLGRSDRTPTGIFTIGENVSVYNKDEIGYHIDRKVEMVQVFGTRWLPLKEAKGIGIQGAPFVRDPKSGKLIENKEVIGKYESDGCIKMLQKDIEELYAIVLKRPTFVQIVEDFREAKLPGREVASPKK